MQRSISNSKILGLIFLAFIMFTQPSWAGRVVKVKGKKILIMLSEDEVETVFKGDKLYLTTKSGKKKAIVVVRKMKGRKVIAKLGKGKAKKGMYTKLKKAKMKRYAEESSMEEASEVAENESSSETERSAMMIGALVGFGQATQNVTNVADMSGSSTAFKGVFDLELFSGLGVKAQIGMDQFSVTGSSGSQEFATDISYIAADFLVRYNYYFGSSFGIYGNAGMGIYSPSSQDLGTNAALQEDSISTTSLFIIGGGVIVPFSGWQIQAGADYLIFPDSEDVSTSVIAGKLSVLFEI